MDSLDRLFKRIELRKVLDVEGSYTKELLEGGVEKITDTISQVSDEVVKHGLTEGREKLLESTADMIYYLLVLLSAKDSTYEEIKDILYQRYS